MYIYPENLKSKAKLWLWELKDIGVIGVGSLISALILTQFKFFIPAVLIALYAFLTIRIEDASIMDFIKYCSKYVFDQQYFEWKGGGKYGEKKEAEKSNKRDDRIKDNNGL